MHVGTGGCAITYSVSGVWMKSWDFVWYTTGLTKQQECFKVIPWTAVKRAIITPTLGIHCRVLFIPFTWFWTTVIFPTLVLLPWLSQYYTFFLVFVLHTSIAGKREWKQGHLRGLFSSTWAFQSSGIFSRRFPLIIFGRINARWQSPWVRTVARLHDWPCLANRMAANEPEQPKTRRERKMALRTSFAHFWQIHNVQAII